MYKYLILDVVNTLCNDLDYKKIKSDLQIKLPVPAVKEKFEKRVFSKPYTVCDDEDKMLLEIYSAFTPLHASPDDIHRALIESMGSVNSKMRDLIVYAKSKGIRVGILADCDAISAKHNCKLAMDLDLEFVYNSSEIKVTKESPMCYSLVTGSLGCSPDEIIFIDDDPDNCKRATEYGWRSFVWNYIDNDFIVKEVTDLLE